jgi:acyl-coenzyme A synthetase/AMP-(fatty) acid ligase
MPSIVDCKPHSLAVRQKLHDDPGLGCGNFLFKVAAQAVDKKDCLFSLDSPWQSPAGPRYAQFSLADFEVAVCDLAAWYQTQGVRPKQVVCTYVSEGIAQFIHALALVSLGAIPAPVNWRMPPSTTLLYHRKYQFDHLVIDAHGNQQAITGLVQDDAQANALADDQGGATVSLLDASVVTTSPLPALPAHWPQGFDTHEAVMLICHSSGTTGIPKAVLFGHQQFFTGKRQRLLAFLERDDDRMFSALPHSHSAGFSYLMTAVMLGLRTHVMSDPCDPAMVAKMQAFAPTIMAGFPQTYAALAEASPPAGSLASLQRSYNTGDTAHEAHVRTLTAAAPDLRFHDGFGASELGMALFLGMSSRKSGIAQGRCIGSPVPFAKARIIDAQRKELPHGEIGYFAIQSPSITLGYYRDPGLTRRCRTADGDWLTGDLGYRNKQGQFFHLDRAVDVIHTPRGKAYTLMLEEAILSGSRLIDVTVVGVPLSPRTSHMVVAYLRLPQAEAAQQVDSVLNLLDGLLLSQLGGPVPVTVVNTDLAQQQPTGATGKALKRVLRDDFWGHHQAFLDREHSLFTHVQSRHLT